MREYLLIVAQPLSWVLWRGGQKPENPAETQTDTVMGAAQAIGETASKSVQKPVQLLKCINYSVHSMECVSWL